MSQREFVFLHAVFKRKNVIDVEIVKIKQTDRYNICKIVVVIFGFYLIIFFFFFSSSNSYLCKS